MARVPTSGRPGSPPLAGQTVGFTSSRPQRMGRPVHLWGPPATNVISLHCYIAARCRIDGCICSCCITETPFLRPIASILARQQQVQGLVRGGRPKQSLGKVTVAFRKNCGVMVAGNGKTPATGNRSWQLSDSCTPSSSKRSKCGPSKTMW